MPGILPVRLESPSVECLVAHAFPKEMLEPKRGIKIDSSDCTVFTVSHLDRGNLDLEKIDNVRLVFEQSLAAISEVAIWAKSKSVAGRASSFVRQIGTTDVKAFFAQGASDTMVGWFSPAFTFEREAAAAMAGFLSNMIVSNGPAANPVPPVTRRVMSSLDLINLGFHTESFINLFSLVDDLTQEVVKAGMTQRGLGSEEQKGLLRAIKEERLRIYLCNLTKLCGWQSLEESQPELHDRILKVNTTRNRIMHGSRRLLQVETIEAVNVLLDFIDWLRLNPFGFVIPDLPVLRIAEPQFSLLPLVESESGPAENTPTGGA
jgi:hypothetical protein